MYIYVILVLPVSSAGASARPPSTSARPASAPARATNVSLSSSSTSVSSFKSCPAAPFQFLQGRPLRRPGRLRGQMAPHAGGHCWTPLRRHRAIEARHRVHESETRETAPIAPSRHHRGWIGHIPPSISTKQSSWERSIPISRTTCPRHAAIVPPHITPSHAWTCTRRPYTHSHTAKPGSSRHCRGWS